MSSNSIYPSFRTLPYIYRLDNPITGEFYIGYREANKVPSHLDLPQYKTSSPEVSSSFESFTWMIFAEFFNPLDAYDFEQLIIHENWGNPLLLNKSCFYGKPRFRCSDYSKLKGTIPAKSLLGISIGRINNDDPRWKSGEIIPINKGVSNVKLKGKTVAVEIETNEKIIITSEEFQKWKGVKYHSINLGCVKSNTDNYRAPKSETHKSNISLSAKSNPLMLKSRNSKISASLIGIKRSEENNLRNKLRQSGVCTVYEISTGVVIKIPRTEFLLNRHLYLGLRSKLIPKK